MKTKNVTLYVSFDGYMKDAGLDIITAPSLKEALKKVSEKHNYGVDEFDDDEEEDKGKGKTIKSILKSIDEQNGDGCDFVISIIQKDNCKVIYTCNE